MASDEMNMKSLYIKNFKNIQELTVSNLGRVNLIVGKNNVGKSTLLEAVSVYLANGNEEYLRQLLANRGEAIKSYLPDEDKEDVIGNRFLSFFNGWQENLSKEFAIVIGESENDKEATRIFQVYILEELYNDEDDLSRKRRIACSKEDLESVSNDSTTVVGRGLKVINGTFPNIISFSRFGRGFSNLENKAKFQYVHTADFQTEKNAVFFDKISLSPEEKYIIEALQIINQRINRINFLYEDEERRGRSARIPVVTLEGDDRRYRLSSMGDGINRILTIILAMLNCKGGVLLLDEFETGLHYSVQDELWRIIFMLSEKLNIQVFVTSHSNDCINSFVKTNTNGQGVLIRLENRKGCIVAVEYDDNNELMFATNNNVEIR